MRPRYLWTNKEINVGDLALLVYGADDFDKFKGLTRVSDMKLIPIRVSRYDEDAKEYWLDLYTIRDKKFVPLEVGKEKINCLIATPQSGILNRLIPYNWREEINPNYIS